MVTLRTELIETQKIRSDLMKWKLLIVAAIGGAALGLSGGSPGVGRNSHLALALIPLACVYVDLLCRHLSLRNKAIGRFVERHQGDNVLLRDYEKFYCEISQKVWNDQSLESWALRGCTTLLSVAIIPVGIMASDKGWDPATWPAMLFYGAGVTGLLLSKLVEDRYQRLRNGVDNWRAAAPAVDAAASS